ncbi:hypothetical protein BKA70DRAFT_1194676 [Coprinopsis sp. MPI-PUGE-AT-0042]|nr:hypothetical protein BKA70DRAFT_1194676 [Coprinopsis sp. MPI-PUGE-AT-0042]
MVQHLEVIDLSINSIDYQLSSPSSLVSTAHFYTMSNNRINKVAIVGATGHIGSHFLKNLLATNKHTVTAVTRTESTSTFPPNVLVSRVDFNSKDSLVSAMRGHDFLIITLSTSASPDTHTRMVQAAAEAGISWVMPNLFGYDPREKDLLKDWVFGAHTDAMIKDVEETKGVNWVVLACGFWYEWSLAAGVDSYGFDIKNRRAVICDDGKAKLNTSTLAMCGKAVAALLSLPITKENPDEPALEDWKNKSLFISSYCISQRDMLDSLHRVMGTKGEDWTIDYQSSKKRVQEGLERLGKGDRGGFVEALYSRTLYPTGQCCYEEKGDLDNGKLALAKESMDESTKWVVDTLEKVNNFTEVSFSA